MVDMNTSGNDLAYWKMRSLHCTTHHHACDCREYRYRDIIETHLDTIAALRREVEGLQQGNISARLHTEINQLSIENNRLRREVERLEYICSLMGD